MATTFCMVVSYVADACHLNEPPCQIQTQYKLKPETYWGYTLVAMTTELP